MSGTSGRSAAFSSASWTMRLSLCSLSHCDFSALMLLHDQPQRPSISPRSIASEISALPG
jgi:hypothetical protein